MCEPEEEGLACRGRLTFEKPVVSSCSPTNESLDGLTIPACPFADYMIERDAIRAIVSTTSAKHRCHVAPHGPQRRCCGCETHMDRVRAAPGIIHPDNAVLGGGAYELSILAPCCRVHRCQGRLLNSDRWLSCSRLRHVPDTDCVVRRPQNDAGACGVESDRRYRLHIRRAQGGERLRKFS